MPQPPTQILVNHNSLHLLQPQPTDLQLRHPQAIASITAPRFHGSAPVFSYDTPPTHTSRNTSTAAAALALGFIAFGLAKSPSTPSRRQPLLTPTTTPRRRAARHPTQSEKIDYAALATAAHPSRRPYSYDLTLDTSDGAREHHRVRRAKFNDNPVSLWPSRDPLGDQMFLRRQIDSLENTRDFYGELQFETEINSMIKAGDEAGYVFVKNQSLSSYDKLGLDRKVVSELLSHLEIQLDMWEEKNGKYVKANQAIQYGYGPVRIVTVGGGNPWLTPIFGTFLVGDVWSKRLPGAVAGGIASNPCEDNAARAATSSWRNTVYSAISNNCIHFAFAIKKAGMPTKPCCNPDGTVWKP